MGFNESILTRRRDELNERGVRMRFAGRRDWRVPKRLIARPGRGDRADPATTARMTFTIAFNYGGRAEIVDAVRALVAEGARRPTRSTRRRSAATSTTPRCPTPTS